MSKSIKTRQGSVRKNSGAARAKAHDRKLLEQAEKETAEAAPSPFRLTGAAFDGGEELRKNSTPADLFHLVFDAPNADSENFLEMAMACVSDDLELIRAAASTDHCLDEVIVRVAQRNHYRIKVAIEVARRVNAARRAEVLS
jgi:hypothetical protein